MTIIVPYRLYIYLSGVSLLPFERLLPLERPSPTFSYYSFSSGLPLSLKVLRAKVEFAAGADAFFLVFHDYNLHLKMKALNIKISFYLIKIIIL